MQGIKNRAKEEKGITLVILVITVLIMMIMSTTIVMNTKNHVQAKAITNLNNDLDVLRQRINVYTATNDRLPVFEKYTGDLSHIQAVKNPNDNENYYIIDIRLLSNLTLNYGQGFYDVVKGISSTDVYMINEKTHNIYYVKGIEIDGEMRYRNE